MILAPDSRVVPLATSSPDYDDPVVEARSQAPTRPVLVPTIVVAPGCCLPSSDFLLRERLASNQDTEVFVALERHSGWLRVVKILREGAPLVARDCMRRELELLLRLSSHQIPRVVDAGTLAGTRPWFAMTRPSGRSLHAELRDHPRGVGLRRAIELLSSTADVLAEVHAAGVVHRDLKPSNLLLGTWRGRESVTLIDFGIATDAGRRLPFISGTPSYIAPEQAEGALPSYEADVFSLGVCGYELLTGQRLDRPDAFDRVRIQRPNWRGSEPEPVRAVLERCMHPDPDRRYRDASYVRDALAGL